MVYCSLGLHWDLVALAFWEKYVWPWMKASTLHIYNPSSVYCTAHYTHVFVAKGVGTTVATLTGTHCISLYPLSFFF